MKFEQRLLAEKWSGDVKTHWSPPEGLFTKSAEEIAKTLHGQSKDLKQAMSRVTFYENRGGSNLSDSERSKLETVKNKLHEMFGSKSE